MYPYRSQEEEGRRFAARLSSPVEEPSGPLCGLKIHVGNLNIKRSKTLLFKAKQLGADTVRAPVDATHIVVNLSTKVIIRRKHSECSVLSIKNDFDLIGIFSEVVSPDGSLVTARWKDVVTVEWLSECVRLRKIVNVEDYLVCGNLVDTDEQKKTSSPTERSGTKVQPLIAKRQNVPTGPRQRSTEPLSRSTSRPPLPPRADPVQPPSPPDPPPGPPSGSPPGPPPCPPEPVQHWSPRYNETLEASPFSVYSPIKQAIDPRPRPKWAPAPTVPRPPISRSSSYVPRAATLAQDLALKGLLPQDYCLDAPQIIPPSQIESAATSQPEPAEKVQSLDPTVSNGQNTKSKPDHDPLGPIDTTQNPSLPQIPNVPAHPNAELPTHVRPKVTEPSPVLDTQDSSQDSAIKPGHPTSSVDQPGSRTAILSLFPLGGGEDQACYRTSTPSEMSPTLPNLPEPNTPSPLPVPPRTAPPRTAPPRTAPPRTAPPRTAPPRTAPARTVLTSNPSVKRKESPSGSESQHEVRPKSRPAKVQPRVSSQSSAPVRKQTAVVPPLDLSSVNEGTYDVRQRYLTPISAQQTPPPAAPCSRQSPQGNKTFTGAFGIPLTFHLLTDVSLSQISQADAFMRAGLTESIIKEGGGELVAMGEATFLLVPLSTGSLVKLTPTIERAMDTIQGRSSRFLVSWEMVFESFTKSQLLDPKEYLLDVERLERGPQLTPPPTALTAFEVEDEDLEDLNSDTEETVPLNSDLDEDRADHQADTHVISDGSYAPSDFSNGTPSVLRRGRKTVWGEVLPQDRYQYDEMMKSLIPFIRSGGETRPPIKSFLKSLDISNRGRLSIPWLYNKCRNLVERDIEESSR